MSSVSDMIEAMNVEQNKARGPSWQDYLRPEHYSVHMHALNYTVTRRLGLYLDMEVDDINPHGVIGDFGGLAELIGFDSLEIQGFKRGEGKVRAIFEEWKNRKDLNPTVGRLVEFLLMMGREDILKDMHSSIRTDVETFLSRAERFAQREAPIQDQTVSPGPGHCGNIPELLTLDEVRSGAQILYDAFVCYNAGGNSHTDLEFVKEMAHRLESEPHNLNLFIPYRDDLAGLNSHKITTTIIAERCRHMIVVLSHNFLESESAEFQSHFAFCLSPSARKRRIVPVRLDDCPTPNIMTFMTLCDFTRSEMGEWNWERLAHSITRPMVADDLVRNPTIIPFECFTADKDYEALRKAMKGFGKDAPAVFNLLTHNAIEMREETALEYETIVGKEDPTLLPFEGFNAEQDCEALRKAMKGLGTNEAAIITVLGHRAMDQRKEIALNFKRMFGKDLSKELASELSGNFETLCVEMLLGTAEFDAKQLNKAIEGLGTDETALVEIICSRTNKQLKDIKTAYKTMFNGELEDELTGDTSGDFKRLLLGCLQANRPEGTEVDRNKAKQDAQALHEAGEKKWGTDKSCFHTIMVSRSYPQLRATFQEYTKVANKDIEDTIKSEMSGDIRDGMLSIVRVIRNKAAFFARQLHKSMEGLGTDDDTLVRVVASRCEVDMVQIKEEFQKAYKQSLRIFIKDDTSGDYKKMLLTLIGEKTKK